ncbi:MAG: 4-alpha-glucanotransferase [Planctomycetota bacterium]
MSTPEPASFTALFPRAGGILAPLSSLPGRHGIGDLGPESLRFVDWLASAGASWWQMLPVGPIGPGNSPYASSSAFAGEPLYLSLERLVDDGLLSAADVSGRRDLKAGNVQYAEVRRFKEPRFDKAFAAWQKRGDHGDDFDAFCDRNAGWLDAWCDAAEDAERARFLQYAFDRQWRGLKHHAAERGVRLMGDAPIFVGLESVDVRSSPELFRLDADGRPEVVTGVPPDDMNPGGQMWGHPHYAWDAHREDDFAWWRARLRRQIDLFDAVRIDHFIGFRNAFEVPADAPDARDGVWAETPGEELLDALRDELDGLPLVAEDLGSVTEEVYALRDAYELPGMRVLQWGFGPDAFHAPHAVPENAVVYPATHDNDTCVGWWRSLDPATKRRFRAATGGEGKTVAATMRRVACATPAHTALVQLQDLLGLGRAARTNTPGTAQGNWVWRVMRRDLTAPRARRFRELLEATDRLPDR